MKKKLFAVAVGIVLLSIPAMAKQVGEKKVAVKSTASGTKQSTHAEEDHQSSQSMHEAAQDADQEMDQVKAKTKAGRETHKSAIDTLKEVSSGKTSVIKPIKGL